MEQNERLKPDFKNRGKTPPVKTCVLDFYMELFFVITCQDFLFEIGESGEYEITEYGTKKMNDLMETYVYMKKFYPEGCHLGKSKFIFPKIETSFNNVIRPVYNTGEKIRLLEAIIHKKYHELFTATFIKSVFELKEVILDIYTEIYEINDYYEVMEVALDEAIRVRKEKKKEQ